MLPRSQVVAQRARGCYAEALPERLGPNDARRRPNDGMGIDKWVCLTVIFYTPQHGNVAISLTDKYEYAKMMTERERKGHQWI